MYGILLSRLGWCPQLLLRFFRQARKTNMQDCWFFTTCFSWTFGSSSKCGLSLFYSRCSLELAQLVLLPFSQGRSTCYSDRLHDFSVNINKWKDFYVNSFFPCAVRSWNSLPIECFPLTYDLSGFKSRIPLNTSLVWYIWSSGLYL